MDTINSVCPLCDNTDNLPHDAYLNTYWENLDAFKDLSIAYCSKCGLGSSVPEIENKKVDGFYTITYREKDSPFYTDFNNLYAPISYDLRSMAQLILAKHFVNFNRGDLFVDIGPGAGASFSTAQTLFENPKMMAVELNQGAADAYRKVYNVETFTSLDEIVISDKKPKVILSSHSLEHFKLLDLKEFLLNIKNILAPDGVFIAEVPHVDMTLHSNMRTNDAPHFLFFSIKSLSKLFSDSGFDILFLNTCEEKYTDWWDKNKLIKNIEIKNESIMKRLLRKVFLYLPYKYFWKKIYSKLKGNKLNFNSESFNYGGDRICLRIVVRANST